VSSDRVRRTATRALAALGRRREDVHVTLVDDVTIRRLNARHLGARRATDVLAFNLEGPGPSPLLGEVIVSVDTARRQARRLRVPVALELDLLVVHGVLHLAGFEDGDPAAARRMHERERDILAPRRGRRGAVRVPERLWSGLLDHQAPRSRPPRTRA
jgi:probable rRNA maturation factor